MSRTVLPFALSALLLLALAVPRTAADDPLCYQYTDCYHCTTAPSGECGWEQGSGMCVRGKSDGPKIGVSYNWVWKSDQCCQPQWNSCTSCVGMSHCGWDGNEGTCSAGNWEGPYNSYSYSWVYENNAACPSVCESYSDCSSCLESANCVWGDGSCMGGSSDMGPFATYGYSGNWHAYMCPTTTWNWEWTTRSIPVWLTFGCPTLLACCGFFVARGRRRRRILREQQGLDQQHVSYPQPVMATAAAPLLGSTNNAEAAAPELYGTAPPMPYYGSAPADIDPLTATKP